MKFNGLMIDCSRLIERHAYYRRLLDYMADWGMNVLLLHFSDDYGCAVELPGYKKLALPRAFSASATRKLVEHAAAKGIEVIPELETFGHTRFITDRREYRQLYVGPAENRLTFNAIDPLAPQTLELMRGLVRATAGLFPSRHLHLGCDEVDMKAYCQQKGLDEAAVWADYTNRMIGYAREEKKIPMIWADHPIKSEEIAKRLRKDVILVLWQYENKIFERMEARLQRLQAAGFREFVCAPGIACYRYRFLPCTIALENTAEHASLDAKYRTLGVINTIWCPWRYLQETLWYAIAYSSRAVKAGGVPDLKRLQTRFAKQVFKTKLTPALREFLELWPRMKMLNNWSNRLLARKYEESTPEELASFDEICAHGERLLEVAKAFSPAANRPVWKAMLLAVRGVLLCARRLRWGALGARELSPAQRREFNRELRTVRAEMSREWDRTRFANDPQKRTPRFPGNDAQYILVLLARMEKL